MRLRELVLEKLAAHEGESFLFSGYTRFPRTDLSFEAHRDAVVADMARRLGAKQQSLRAPPDPRLISIKSWQFGFSAADDDDGAARSFRDGVFLGLQNYRGGYLSSQRWQSYLAAFDRPGRWVELGQALEHEGWLIEANACFAAARWLDPTREPAIAAITGARDPGLPRRLRDQPATDYPALPFHERHWRAWDMKNYGHLDLPTLLRWECDHNFSIRTRIYRSLGQRPHPAAIQALQEAMHDPHPFARAQAVRSLGWCADPTGVGSLRSLATEDPHPEVRRTAAKAIERIVGFWTFFGEWNAIATSPERTLAAARQLAELGLGIFAWEVTVHFGGAGSGKHPAIDALSDDLERYISSTDNRDGGSDYSDWFAEARAIESAADSPLTVEAATSAAGEPAALGFEARRTLRRLGLGSLNQRRLPTTTHES